MFPRNKASIYYLVLATVLTGCTPAPEAPPSGPLPAVDIALPLRQTVVKWLTYSGRYHPAHQVDVRSRVGGFLDKILFQDGQQVTAGAPLFVLDKAPFEIALRRAQVGYQLATREYDRSETLFKRNVISKSDYEDHKQRMIVAKAALEEAQLKIEYTQVSAPLSGHISRHFVDVGNLVRGDGENNTVLARIVDRDVVHFYFQMSEYDLLANPQTCAALKNGEKIPAFAPRPGKEGESQPGYVDFADNRLDPQTGTLELRAVFDNAGHEITPGMLGRIRLQGMQDENALLIPTTAIGYTQDKKHAYVLDKTGRIILKPLVTGTEVGEYHVVTAGLLDTDQIIVSGGARVRPGMMATGKTVTLTPPQVQG